MRLHIRPGKVTCAGIVVIFMVLPNSMWQGADAKNAPSSKLTIEAVKPVKKDRDSSSLDRPHDHVTVDVCVWRHANNLIKPLGQTDRGAPPIRQRCRH